MGYDFGRVSLGNIRRLVANGLWPERKKPGWTGKRGIEGEGLQIKTVLDETQYATLEPFNIFF